MTTYSKQQFKVHSIVGIDQSISLAKIGELSPSQLELAIKHYTDCSPIGWESKLSDYDIELSKRYNFDIEACIKEEFVLFGFTGGTDKQAQLALLFDLFPDSAYEPFGVLCCDSFFAHAHDDKSTVKSAGQIMFIIENEANHRLYSEDSNCEQHTYVPKKGDIIFLDVWQSHAVFPDQSKGIDFMIQNGMKMVCFAID